MSAVESGRDLHSLGSRSQLAQPPLCSLDRFPYISPRIARELSHELAVRIARVINSVQFIKDKRELGEGVSCNFAMA